MEIVGRMEEMDLDACLLGAVDGPAPGEEVRSVIVQDGPKGAERLRDAIEVESRDKEVDGRVR